MLYMGYVLIALNLANPEVNKPLFDVWPIAFDTLEDCQAAEKELQKQAAEYNKEWKTEKILLSGCRQINYWYEEE